MIKQSVLLTFNSLLVSTEKGFCVVNARAPMLLSHAWQCTLPTIPSGGAHQAPLLPAAIRDFTWTLSSSSSHETPYHMDWGIWQGMRYRNLSAASKLFPWKGPWKEKKAKSNPTLFNTFQALMGEKKQKTKEKKKAAPTIQYFNITEIKPSKAVKAWMSFS